jgi:hypothetical protein
MIHYFLVRYSAWTHAVLLGWNSVALFYLGSADFRNELAGLQHDLHLPTWTLVLLTGLINITIAYRNWQKQR